MDLAENTLCVKIKSLKKHPFKFTVKERLFS